MLERFFFLSFLVVNGKWKENCFVIATHIVHRVDFYAEDNVTVYFSRFVLCVPQLSFILRRKIDFFFTRALLKEAFWVVQLKHVKLKKEFSVIKNLFTLHTFTDINVRTIIHFSLLLLINRSSLAASYMVAWQQSAQQHHVNSNHRQKSQKHFAIK